tara:strand:- start:531 stop:677 length:147 start_codon:yes stop_codon:yes gene_type:complete
LEDGIASASAHEEGVTAFRLQVTSDFENCFEVRLGEMLAKVLSHDDEP